MYKNLIFLLLISFAGFAQTDLGIIDKNTSKLPRSGLIRLSSDSLKLYFRGVTGASKEVISTNNTYSNPSWISSLSWSKIISTPTTIAGYGITDYNSLFDTRLGTKTTSDISEGSNLYWTNARGDARYPQLTGSYSDPSWLILSINKTTGLQSALDLKLNISTASSTYFPLVGGQITGTGGSGYIGYTSQSSAPSAPSSGFRLYANSSNALSWIGANGFTRTFDGTANTANRTYTLPDASGTFGLLGSNQTWSGTNTFTGNNTYGTPSSITLTNATGLPLNSGVTGLLPDANIASASAWNAGLTNLAGLTSGQTFKGNWNASTNTPTLTTTPSANGDYYLISVAGTSSITGTSTSMQAGGRVISNGTAWVYSAAFNNDYKQVKIMSWAGDLSINTTTKKVSTTGQLFVVANGTYYDVSLTQSLTSWDSDTTRTLHYILFETTTKLFKVVKYDRIGSYNLNNHVLVGLIGNNSTNTLFQVEIEGTYLLNGVRQKSTTLSSYGITDGVTITGLNPYRTGKVMSFAGDLSINTVTRKISTTGQLFVVENGNYYDVSSTQAATDWESTATLGNGLHYIIFEKATKLFKVVKFNAIGSYDFSNFILIGFVGNNVSTGGVFCYIEGDYILNGTRQALTEKASTTQLNAAVNPYKWGKLVSWAGDLTISTTARTISTTGQLFVAVAGNYYNVSSAQTSTAWDYSDDRYLKYILFNTSTLLFRVVQYDRIGSYDMNSHILVGVIGQYYTGGIVQHNIEGTYVLNGIRYPTPQTTTTNYNKSLIGNVDYQGFNTDYSHVIFYGQSLSMGWEAQTAITTDSVGGAYMIGDRVWINRSNSDSTTFRPLVATFNDPVGESPAVSATNVFKGIFDKYHYRTGQVKFLVTNAGQGGMSVEKLSKTCTNGTTEAANLYHTEFLKTINSAKAKATALGKTISCPAIVWMQGEHNYTGSGLGLTTGTEATKVKSTYKALVVQLKNDMQANIMAKYGQTSKPLFFIYQTAGTYINNDTMSINVAQIELAAENDDIILLNPTYQTPDYNHGHLTANGYRWYGELIAKGMYESLIKGERHSPVVGKKVTITSPTTLEIDFYVPVAPLAFDTKTVQASTANGFKVKNNGSEVTISSSTINGNKVILTTSGYLSAGTVEVTYAGFGRNGTGNLRDSDAWVSKYTYYNDSGLGVSPTYEPQTQSGGSIYGQKYPMYNFCSNFYFKITY